MKLNLHSVLCLTLLLCFCPILANAQINTSNYYIPTVFPKSPTSTAFAKYGDYQVNLFTGLPEISIPLYTVQSGGLEVPITLSYHASGNKVSDVASWVGLGWSLSNGGSITRKTMGLPDESDVGILGAHFWQSSYDLDKNVDDIDYASLVAAGSYDSQPDIFSYDFPGHNGRFFFEGSNSYKPALIPFSPIKITNSTPVSPTYAINFNILDEHGNLYGFGKTATEYSTTVASGHTTGSTSGWMLESMISQNRRDTISFTYTNQVMSYPDEVSQQDVVEDQITNGPYIAKYTPRSNTFPQSSFVGEENTSSILFKNGKVVFELDTAKRKDQPSGSIAHPLKDIQVYGYNYSTKTYQLQKKVVFFTSYFFTDADKRLRLDSIELQDAAGSIIQHYRFGYNTSVPLPHYTSFAKDYWGYYNGKTNSTSLQPQFTYASDDGLGHITNYPIGVYSLGVPNPATNNRNSDSLYTQAFMLDTIYYPTGGHTIFNYQTNRFIDPVNGLQLVGSLRIASIQSYDGVNPTPIVKTYQYNDTKARANYMLDFSYFVTNQKHQYWESGPSGGGAIAGTEMYHSFVSTPHTDPTPFDQALVVYPAVTEYIGTPGTNIGRTDYLFRDYPDAPQTNRAGGPAILQSNTFRRGQLISKTDYIHKSDGTYQIVKKDSSTYTAFAINNHETAGWVIAKTILDEGPGAPGVIYYDPAGNDQTRNPNGTNHFLAQNYSISSDDNYLTGTISYLYDTTDPTKYTTSSVAYNYDNITHQQVTRTYHNDSQGNTRISLTKYPADYLNGTTTHNVLLDTMLNRNMQAEVIEKRDSLINAASGLHAIAGAQFNQFTYGNIVGVVVPWKISTLSVGAPLTNFSLSSINSSTGAWVNDSRYIQMISFDSYDGQNNIVQYTPRNSTPVSIIWDYQYALPIAQVKNAINANTAYTSFEANGKGNWIFSGAPVGSATAPGGLNVYSLNSGSITSSFINTSLSYIVSYWSNNGAATVNSTTGTPMRTYNGWTYYEHVIPSGTSIVTVSGTTTIDELRLYPANAQMTTYAYDPNGLTGIADVKGQISHFEYDPFQRLKNIKDINGNIVSNYGYHTYDMTVSSDAQSGTFTRNNCLSGTTPQSTTYSVAAGKYLSSTKASANAEAVYDLNTNGQIKANIVCGCPVQMVNVTLTNNSGLAGFQAHFTGPNTYNFNFSTSGSTIVQVAAGNTYTLQIPGVSPFNNHTFTLGTRTPVVAPSATWTSVNIATGSSDLTVTVQ